MDSKRPKMDVPEAEQARDFALRVSIYFGAIFANLGLYLPFMPIWLAWRGMSPFEIGVLTAAPLLVRIVATPAIGIWSDASGNHRRTIIIGGWFGLFCAAMLVSAQDFWTIMVLVVGFQIATQSILPIVEAKSLAGARKLGLDYGRMRLWGSATFIAANVIGGFVVARFGSGSIVVMVIATVLCAALAAHGLPQTQAQNGKDQPTQVRLSERLQLAGRLISRPWFILLVMGSGLIQGSHAVFYAFSAIHWRAVGISDHWIGLLWALGVLAEIGLFAISGRLLARFNAVGLVVCGGLAGVVRWALMALEPSFAVLFPLQCLHAFTFGATHLGTINLIQARVPSDQAGSAQSIYAALGSGVVMGMTTLLAGALYEQLDAASFWVMSALAFVGTLATVAIMYDRSTPKAEL